MNENTLFSNACLMCTSIEPEDSFTGIVLYENLSILSSKQTTAGDEGGIHPSTHPFILFNLYSALPISRLRMGENMSAQQSKNDKVSIHQRPCKSIQADSRHSWDSYQATSKETVNMWNFLHMKPKSTFFMWKVGVLRNIRG